MRHAAIHVDLAGGDFRDRLEIEIHLVERVGDVAIGLALDLALQLGLAQTGRHIDDLADDMRAGDRHGHVLAARTGALDGAIGRLRHLLDLGDGVFHDRVLRQRLDREPLDTIMLTGLAQLQHLDRRGADVHADQRRARGAEEILQFDHIFPLIFQELT